MVEARDMVLVSFPFAAGVALSQFCHFPLFHICLALSAVLILLALADALSREEDTPFTEGLCSRA